MSFRRNEVTEKSMFPERMRGILRFLPPVLPPAMGVEMTEGGFMQVGTSYYG